MRDARLNDLLSAAKEAAKWMRWWLDQNECGCEGEHICGHAKRMRELKKLESAIVRVEGK